MLNRNQLFLIASTLVIFASVAGNIGYTISQYAASVSQNDGGTTSFSGGDDDDDDDDDDRYEGGDDYEDDDRYEGEDDDDD